MKRFSQESLSIRSLARARLVRFSREEDGVLTFFTIFMLFMLLMVCGIAVDLMRNEMERVKVQNTLDRAIVAAADLQQVLKPEDVVKDYFEKAGIEEYLGDIVVTPGDNLPTNYFRTVQANARARTSSPYMAMTGVDSLPLYVSGMAEEVVSNLEISLVLDVSGSMNNNSRLTNLKIAAKDFVDQIANNSQDGRMAISIIPYATQVSVPDNVADAFDLEGVNDYSNCINFTADDFETTGMRVPSPLPGAPELTPYERTMHFDPWQSSFDGREYNPIRLVQRPVCEEDSKREILVLQKDRDVLKNYIEALTARGNTSIDIGMKWGAALLDQTMQPVIDALIDDGTVSDQFDPRPAPYNSDEYLKVIVLMTDGANTSQYYIPNTNQINYREGLTDIWWNDEEETYSTYDADNQRFYYSKHFDTNGDGNVSNNDRWGIQPYGCANPSASLDQEDWDCGPDAENGGATRLTFPELWAHTPIKTNYNLNYSPWLSGAYNTWRNNIRKSVNASTKDSRSQDICDEAKAAGVIVFAIGFEAQEGGKAVLKNCASSASHYFDVDGLEIADAFTAIAHEITQLRLTQ